MTVTQLIARVKNYLRYDLDGYFGAVDDVTDADVVAALNDAQREIAKAAYLVEPSTTLTMTAGQSQYDLRDTDVVGKKALTVLRVIVGGETLKKPSGSYGLWTYQELEQQFPEWRDADNGTPYIGVQLGTSLIIVPPPTSSVISGGGNYIVHTKYPEDMSASSLSAEPDIPEDLHEALAKLAAAKAADPNVTEGHQDARVSRLYSQAMSLAMETGRANLKMWNAPASTPKDRSFIRR